MTTGYEVSMYRDIEGIRKELATLAAPQLGLSKFFREAQQTRGEVTVVTVNNGRLSGFPVMEPGWVGVVRLFKADDAPTDEPGPTIIALSHIVSAEYIT